MKKIEDMMAGLIEQIEKLHARHELASQVGPDYFEPGMMEYLGESDAVYDRATGEIELVFEARGTRYEGRSEEIEHVKVGNLIRVIREETNPYNSNNFTLTTKSGRNVGNMPAELCNVIAPLYDRGILLLKGAEVSFVEPITKRSRHAKQAVLFVRLTGVLM